MITYQIAYHNSYMITKVGLYSIHSNLDLTD